MKAALETKQTHEVVLRMSYEQSLALSDALMEVGPLLVNRMRELKQGTMLWHAMNAAQTQLELLHSALGMALAEVKK